MPDPLHYAAPPPRNRLATVVYAATLLSLTSTVLLLLLLYIIPLGNSEAATLIFISLLGLSAIAGLSAFLTIMILVSRAEITPWCYAALAACCLAALTNGYLLLPASPFLPH